MAEVNFLVKKGLTVPKGSASTPAIIFDASDPTTGIYSPAANQLAISTNGTGRLFVDSNGRIGAGIPNPGAPLAVASEGGLNLALVGRNNAPADEAQLYFMRNNGSTIQALIGVNNDNLSFHTGSSGSERLRITSDGKVGLGTSSPQTLLHLNSATGTNTTLAYSENNVLKWYNRYNASDGSFQVVDVVNSTTRLHVSNTGNVGIGTTSAQAVLHTASADSATTALFSGATNQIRVYGHLASFGGTYLEAINSASTAYSPFGLNGNYLSFQTQATERARIDSSGRLLVGTSSSASAGQLAQYSKLQVLGNTVSEFGIVSIARNEAASSITAGENLGAIAFVDSSGNDYAWILGAADATAGTNDYPGRLVFSVTADGASSPTEAMRIKNSRIINIANTPTYADNAAAKTGGLVDGDVYRTSTGDLKIVYT